jgi:acetyltransferase-like isoleucine patch superfamily enzyme
MKGFLQVLIRRFKSESFSFDDEVTSREIAVLVLERIIMLIRGLRVSLFFPVNGLIFVGRSVKVMGKCTFGKSVTIGSYSNISGLCRNQVCIGDGVNIGRFSSVIASTNYNDIGEGIVLNNNVGIGEYAYLGGAGGLKIGSDTIIGQYFSCHPENHNFLDRGRLIRFQGVNREGIEIGRNNWIGSKVTFLDGSAVGENCVVAAGAVVTKKFGDNLLIGGVPAKILKNLS